jgi:hypothetical protein
MGCSWFNTETNKMKTSINNYYDLGRDISRPIEWVNVMIGEKILTNSGSMGPGVILLEN